MQSSAYTIEETIARRDGTVVCRAVRNVDRCPVLLKRLDPRQTAPKAFERLKKEFEIGRTLQLEGMVKPLALETHDGMPTLTMEDFGGRPLDSMLGAPMDLRRFLDRAVRIASAVADVHRQGIVHGDLRPENIVVNPATGEVKIADFGLASRLPREMHAARPRELIEGSLPYLSPEQTGRMNRAVDSRSDLYSVGVTLYVMLTGRLPFDARDPLEWIYCHIACASVSPAEIVPTVPAIVGRIVQKLLAKMADDRYQTARGLEHDLERCADQWRHYGTIEEFRLAERDVPDRPSYPQKLYGRGNELRELTVAFERVAETGRPRLVLVSGYAGIGKSSLVHELQKPVAQTRGIYLAGKFDQYARNIPYYTIVHAFTQLVLDVLAEDEEHRNGRQKELCRTLGANAQLIIDVIPPLELLIGKQPAVPTLPLDAAERRFRRVFLNFVRYFAGKGHVLVLFVDDLQWADAASLQLMEAILTDPETRYVLTVGAFREAEIPPSHPLPSMVERIRATAGVDEVVLRPLGLESMTALLADAVHSSPERAQSLARLVLERTGGNPFFTLQFLATIYEEQLLQLDQRSLTWQWDVEGIKRWGYSDNVVDLMVRRMSGLPGAAREVLQTAACLGNKISSALLALAHGKSEEMTSADLWEAVREGLIVRSNHSYAFAHDRVQQAAYSLIPEPRRPSMHLSLGRLMLANTPPEQLGERLFDLVTQLDLGAALVTDPDERVRIADLNLRAARRAKAAAAHASAVGYLTVGQDLLPANPWDQCYELAHGIHVERAQCEWLRGRTDIATGLLDVLLLHARGRLDRAQAFRLKVDLHAARGEIEVGARLALAAVSTLFGIDLPLHPPQTAVKEAIAEILRGLGERPIEDLFHLPVMTDAEMIEGVALLSASLAPAYFVDPNLHYLMGCRIVELSIRHGHSESGPHGYVIFGAALGHLFARWDEARRFGDLARRIVESPWLAKGRGKSSTYYTIASFLEFWSAPLPRSAQLFAQCYESAVESFEVTNACFGAEKIAACRWIAGEPLVDVDAETDRRLEFARSVKCHMMQGALAERREMLKTLRGCTGATREAAEHAASAASLSGAPVDAHPLIRFYHFMYTTITAFVLGDYERAAMAARESAKHVHLVTDQPPMAESTYFSALALAAHYDDAPASGRDEVLRQLLECQEQHRVLQEQCPETFANRYALVSAEVARIEGRVADAMGLYEQAVDLARRHGFVHHEGIACERGAQFYASRGVKIAAEAHLRQARSCYARWGAEAKVRRLDRLHPWLGETAGLPTATAFTARFDQLDLLSVVKASQTVSSEIVLDNLVRTLLRVLLEQSGAQSAFLISHREGKLLIDATAAVAASGAIASDVGSTSSDASLLVPVSVLRYTILTKTRVILDERAIESGKFAGEPYFERAKPRSVLCLPILKQARVVGLLYFENRLISGAFTPERLTALELLAAQSAISMENARLLSAERAARAASEQAEQNAALLAEAGALFSESLDYERSIQALSELCVQRLADWCVIDIVEDSGIRRAAGAHANPEKAHLVRELQRRFPPRWDSRHPSATVQRTGRALLLHELSDDMVRASSEDDEHAKLIGALGTRSAVIVPMKAREQTLGWISLSSATPGRYGRAELELGQELARRVAIAIDNVRLYRASQEAVQIRDEFLSIASHELYTPMTSLGLSLQTLERTIATPLDPARLAKTVAVATRQGGRLTRLIGDLLDSTRIQKGKVVLRLGSVDLEEVTHEVLARFEPNLANARCVVTVRSDGPVVGQWDRSRLDQAITNIVSNAIKFGAGHPIEVTAGTRDGWAWLAVTDHGIGIEPRSQARIFERFERGVPREHYGGLGLGLYISAKIVEAHGGAIRVESKPGAGAKFTLELPCAGL